MDNTMDLTQIDTTHMTNNDNSSNNSVKSRYLLYLKKSQVFNQLTGDNFDINYTMKIRNPVVHYITEPKGSDFTNARRIFAFALSYKKNEETNQVTVYYGASVFRRDYENETFTKKTIKNTAVQRFRINPNAFTFEFNETDNNKLKVEEIAKIARFATTKISVKGETRNKEAQRVLKEQRINERREKNNLQQHRLQNQEEKREQIETRS